MADFCGLCGYSDIDVIDIYNRLIRPDLKKNMKLLISDKHVIGVNVSGVCEHCGLVSFGINNKYEAIGYYWDDDLHVFGHVDPETLELIIDEDDPKYADVRFSMKQELEQMERYFEIYEENKHWIEIQRDLGDKPLSQDSKDFLEDLKEMGVRKRTTFTSGNKIDEFDEVLYGLIRTGEDSADLITFSIDEIDEIYEVDHSVPITASGFPTLKIK